MIAFYVPSKLALNFGTRPADSKIVKCIISSPVSISIYFIDPEMMNSKVNFGEI